MEAAEGERQIEHPPAERLGRSLSEARGKIIIFTAVVNGMTDPGQVILMEESMSRVVREVLAKHESQVTEPDVLLGVDRGQAIVLVDPLVRRDFDRKA